MRSEMCVSGDNDQISRERSLNYAMCKKKLLFCLFVCIGFGLGFVSFWFGLVFGFFIYSFILLLFIFST